MADSGQFTVQLKADMKNFSRDLRRASRPIWKLIMERP